MGSTKQSSELILDFTRIYGEKLRKKTAKNAQKALLGDKLSFQMVPEAGIEPARLF